MEINFQTKYKAYNSSWIKFFSAFILHSIGIKSLSAENVSPLEKAVGLALYSTLPLYFLHNLYAEYQYNKALESTLEIKINGETTIVKASPEYFSIYTAYNAFMSIATIGKIGYHASGSETLAQINNVLVTDYRASGSETLAQIRNILDTDYRVSGSKTLVQISNVLFISSIIFKLGHLFTDDYQPYHFTNIETGEEIDQSVIKAAVDTY